MVVRVVSPAYWQLFKTQSDMQDLENHIKLSEENCKSENLCSKFTDNDLMRIGAIVVDGYEADEGSRTVWKKRYETAMNLAVQLQEQKTFPWAGASNVKFPLVTIASMQWHSRAYPLLVSGPDLVRVRVFGPDPAGDRHAIARAVGEYMSWQLLEENDSWEEQTDRALMQLPIIGCIFKKLRYDPEKQLVVSEAVSPMDLVLNYYSKSVESCPRKTHVIPMFRNAIYTRVARGIFRDCEGEAWYSGIPGTNSQSESKADRRTGMAAPAVADQTTPVQFLEQHVHLDLDDDGYEEPYIITVEKTTGYVVRIVTNFDWEDVIFMPGTNGKKISSIKESQYFVKYGFIPSPDGGIYDIGFGALLGPLNQSVDSIINQLIDAGTLQTTSGGFLGRGIKIRGGEISFRQFGWQRVDSTADDISKNIFPFPVREPSNTLYQLLGLLIEYTNRISGSTDIMVGENPGQNTPAETSRLLAEQGSKINSAIFKRVWRSMGCEYKAMYAMNGKYMKESVNYGDTNIKWVSRDYFRKSRVDISPVADPHLASDTALIQQAQFLAQRAMGVPGYDRDKVERRLLRALRVDDVDAIYPGPEKIPAPPPLKVVLEQMKNSREDGKSRMKLAEKVIELQTNHELVQAQIMKIYAEISQIISGIGIAKGAQQLEALNSQVKVLQAQDASTMGYLNLIKEMTGNATGNAPDPSGSSGPTGAGGPGVGSAGPAGIPPVASKPDDSPDHGLSQPAG